MSTDRIEKTTVLNVPRSRVWRALTTPGEFGAWFGCRLTTPFTPGARIAGPITIPKYEHLTMEFVIDRVEPEHLFSYRWHPYGIDPNVDYSAEPMTLVEFRLTDMPDGTELTIVESGFDQIPAARRAEVYKMNTGGWTAQVANIEKHLATHAHASGQGARQ